MPGIKLSGNRQVKLLCLSDSSSQWPSSASSPPQSFSPPFSPSFSSSLMHFCIAKKGLKIWVAGFRESRPLPCCRNCKWWPPSKLMMMNHHQKLMMIITIVSSKIDHFHKSLMAAAICQSHMSIHRAAFWFPWIDDLEKWWKWSYGSRKVH